MCDHEGSQCAIMKGPNVRSSKVPSVYATADLHCKRHGVGPSNRGHGGSPPGAVKLTVSGRQTGVTVDHLPGRLGSGPPDSANSHAAVAGPPETGPRGLPCELTSHASVAGLPETGPQRLQREPSVGRW